MPIGFAVGAGKTWTECKLQAEIRRGGKGGGSTFAAAKERSSIIQKGRLDSIINLWGGGYVF